MRVFHVVIFAAAFVALVLGGRWLFRQRSPEEIVTAWEKLKALKRK